MAPKRRRFAKLFAVATLLLLALLAGCQAQPTPVPVPVDHVIGYGQTVKGQLAGTENRWLFVATQGSLISVEFTNTGQDTPLVAVVNPNGESIARVPASTGHLDRFRLLADGQYAIVVGTGTGDYTLSLRLVDSGQRLPTTAPASASAPLTSNVIGLDQERTGTLQTGDAQVLWSFIGPANRVVTIRMNRVSGDIDPVLHMFAPDGTMIASDDNSGGGRNAMIAGLTLPVTGTYLIQVSGNGRIGDYELIVQSGAPLPTPTSTPTRIPPTQGPTPTPSLTPVVIDPVQSGAQIRIGQTVQATLTKSDEVDRFIVFGPAGAEISLGMFPGKASKLVPAFEMFAPNGNQVVTADGAGGAISRGYTLPATGAYIIFAHSDNNQTLGDYTLTVGDGMTLRDLDGGKLLPDASFPGNLLRTGDREIWSIDLPANATISVEVAPYRSSLTPMADVVGPDNKILLAAQGTSHGLQSDNATTIVQGKYQVRISAPDASIGDYVVKLHLLNVQPTPTFSLSLDETLSVNVQQGERYTYSFKAIPGEVVLINAHTDNPDGFDPVIELYGPSGRRLATADDLNANNVDAVLQIALDDGTGAYTVQIYGYALMPGKCTVHIKSG